MKPTEELVPDGAEIVAEIRTVLYVKPDGTQDVGTYFYPQEIPVLDALGLLTYTTQTVGEWRAA